MGEFPVVVVDVEMDDRWAGQAQIILAHGASEGRFNLSMSSLYIGQRRALCAFLGEEGEPEDAVGIATYATFQTNEHHRILRVDKLCVLPVHRREGVAHAIMSRAYDVAVERGCTEIDALISTFNFPMMRMIQKAGFKPEIVHMRKYVTENQPADDWDF